MTIASGPPRTAWQRPDGRQLTVHSFVLSLEGAYGSVIELDTRTMSYEVVEIADKRSVRLAQEYSTEFYDE